MSIDNQPAGGTDIVKVVDENVSIEEDSVLQKLFEKDPILRDLFERDRRLQRRIMEREALRTAKLQSLKKRLKKAPV